MLHDIFVEHTPATETNRRVLEKKDLKVVRILLKIRLVYTLYQLGK